MSVSNLVEWRVRDDEIAKVAAELTQQTIHPIDALEVTALLESMGYTDEVARKRYGMQDAFELGDAVFTHLRVHNAPMHCTEPPSTVYTTGQEILLDYAKGLVALVPPIVVLLTIYVFSRSGAISPSQILLLSAGMTGSMLATNGFVQAISRRTAIYLSMLKPRMAGRYFTLSTGITTVGLIGVVLFMWPLFAGMSAIPLWDQTIFVFAFIGLTVVWMAAGGLSLIGRGQWLSIGLAAGLFTGTMFSLLVRPYLHAHIAIGIVVGYGATMSLIGYQLYQGYWASHSGKAASAIYPFPSAAYMMAEASHYFAYGCIYMILVLLPHLLGWLGTPSPGQDRSWNVTNTEVGLTLSMLPLILGYGVAEHAIRQFWRTAAVVQTTTPGNDVTKFGQALHGFCARQRKHYAWALGVLSLLAFLIFRAIAEAGLLEAWLHVSNSADLVFIFNIGLVAYALLGIGLFNCMFALTLGYPRVATTSVIWASLALLAFGVGLVEVSFTYAAVAFACAAAVFAVLSWILIDKVIKSADYYFVSTI